MRFESLPIAAAIVMVACACDPTPNPCGVGLICLDTGPDADAGPPPDGDPGLDARDAPDVGVVPCGAVGSLGGHCRTGDTCGAGECRQEIVEMGTMARLTLRSAFAIEQGGTRDATTGFYTEAAAPDVADDVPLPILTGDLCTQDCDASAMTDSCGTCATCDQAVGTAGLLATFLFYGAAGGPFGDDTGWCRADCTFNPATAGGCPDAHTCSPASNTCVEGCVSDNECRFSIETTREGFGVSVIDDTSTATCNPTTHRCDWTHASANSVGDPCDDSTDCTEDVGLCIRGGTCAEYECGRASDTDTTTFVCDGGRGVCLGNGGNMGSICVAGCTEPDDCNPGSTCQPFDPGETAGSFTGFCLGVCDARLDDPDGTAGPLTTADDQLIPCRTDERCDYPAATAEDLDPAGTCSPSCAVDADCTGDAGNYCEIVEGSDPMFGFCRWLGQACDDEDLSADCFGDEVCDLLAREGEPGLCGAACSDTSCDAGETCIASRGVCRLPCTIGGTACPTGLSCLGNATAGFFCEQPATP